MVGRGQRGCSDGEKRGGQKGRAVQKRRHGRQGSHFFNLPAGPPRTLSRTSAGPDRQARSAAAAALPVIGSTTKARKTRTFGATAGRSVVFRPRGLTSWPSDSCCCRCSQRPGAAWADERGRQERKSEVSEGARERGEGGRRLPERGAPDRIGPSIESRGVASKPGFAALTSRIMGRHRPCDRRCITRTCPAAPARPPAARSPVPPSAPPPRPRPP